MDYEIIGQVKASSGKLVPLLNIPMMSDERWQQLAIERARKHFL